jgi:hypothetical protein
MWVFTEISVVFLMFRQELGIAHLVDGGVDAMECAIKLVGVATCP